MPKILSILFGLMVLVSAVNAEDFDGINEDSVIYMPETVIIGERPVEFNNANDYYYMGCKESEKGNYEEAIKLFSTFTELRPKYSLGWVALGKTYFLIHQENNAITAYRTALKLDPKDARANLGLGQIISSGAKDEEAHLLAISYLEQSIKSPGRATDPCFNYEYVMALARYADYSYLAYESDKMSIFDTVHNLNAAITACDNYINYYDTFDGNDKCINRNSGKKEDKSALVLDIKKVNEKSLKIKLRHISMGI